MDRKHTLQEREKIYCCSFGSINLALASMRFYALANAMDIFEDIMLYNECSLDLDFKAYFKDRFYKTTHLTYQRNGGGQ